MLQGNSFWYNWPIPLFKKENDSQTQECQAKAVHKRHQGGWGGGGDGVYVM